MGVLWLDEVDKDDILTAGGKGANLGELLRIGIPVPEGFIVDANTYKTFIESTGLRDKIIEILNSVDVNNMKELEEASKRIRELIESTPMPKEVEEEIKKAYRQLCEEVGEEVYVAVRSSATAEDLPEASFAGQQDTYLNVRGEDEVVDKVRKCWSSLYTPRAIFYRVQQGIRHEDVSIAVVVQKMVNSEKSGVMFTSHPVTGEKIAIIEAVFGLGEAIVSGAVTPDHYEYDRVQRKLIKVEVAEKKFMLTRQDSKTVKVELGEKGKERVLSDKEIEELVKLGEIIEEHYGYPQDIEWAIEKGKIYIVQSRAVTTIKPKKEEVAEVEEGEILVKGLGASPGIGIGRVKIVLKKEDINKVEEGDVLVTVMTTPDMVPAMRKASAIVTDEGGYTCHAAIVSRELGVPAVVGTGNATKVLKDGMIVTVDGEKGVVYKGALKQQKEKVEEKVIAVAPQIITATEVKVNISIPDVAEKVAKETNADGVGLFRIEHMVLGLKKHPMKYIKDGQIDEYVEELYKGMKKVVQAFYPKPVWIRTLDAPTDEFRSMEGGEDEPIEANPMLGFRGIRRDLREEEHFRAEMKAIKKLIDEGYTNVGIMLPLVTSVEEVKKAKQIALEEGIPLDKIDFGIMVETPASALIIEDIIKECGITFISFGTNDLTQYTLAVDRNNENVAYLYNEFHPAVVKLIEHVIKVCKKYGVKTSICGQAGSNPKFVEKLIKLGIDSVSANPDAVQKIRETVARVEKKIILDKLRELNV
jgi:pyruvate,water dikinase